MVRSTRTGPSVGRAALHIASAGFLLVATAACGSPAAQKAASPRAEASAHAEERVYRTDYPNYTNSGELFEKATVVVQGRISSESRVVKFVEKAPTGSNPHENPLAGAPSGAINTPNDDGIVATVRAVTVQRVLKGNARLGQILEVKQLGGVHNGVTYTEENAPNLQSNRVYTLFLETYPNQPASLLHPIQGQFPLDTTGAPQSLPGNTIKLTRADLDRFGG